MDLIDRKILDLLQRDATLAIAEVADQVGLSPRRRAGSASSASRRRA